MILYFKHSKFYAYTGMVLMALFLYSCVDVNFAESMPHQGEVYESFPQVLKGVYVNVDDSSDKLIIQEKELVVDGATLELQPGIELKYSNNYYVLNFLDKAGWTIYLGRLKNPDRVLIYGFDPDDTTKLKLLQSITHLEIEYDENGDMMKCRVNPSDAEFREILKRQAFTLYGEYERRD